MTDKQDLCETIQIGLTIVFNNHNFTKLGIGNIWECTKCKMLVKQDIIEMLKANDRNFTVRVKDGDTT